MIDKPLPPTVVLSEGRWEGAEGSVLLSSYLLEEVGEGGDATLDLLPVEELVWRVVAVLR